MATETWIVYKTESMSDRGWEERMLMPDKSITNILEENWSVSDFSGTVKPAIPQPGDRTRAYKSSESSDDITYAREGDWVVTRVERFASFDTDNRIVVCYCKYDPPSRKWEQVRRGASANELLQTETIAF
ncbi:MAG: hypothetical protein EBE86_030085 [Hormoscilla sp. GUM202]|nr:hypothetical protein [Hormoscilla sp. GUM202]